MGVIATGDGSVIRRNGQVVAIIRSSEIKERTGTDADKEAALKGAVDSSLVGFDATVELKILDRGTGEYVVNVGRSGRTLEKEWWTG